MEYSHGERQAARHRPGRDVCGVYGTPKARYGRRKVKITIFTVKYIVAVFWSILLLLVVVTAVVIVLVVVVLLIVVTVECMELQRLAMGDGR